jgi:hypothetical protein
VSFRFLDFRQETRYAQKTATFHLNFGPETIENARYEMLTLYSLEHLQLADEALGRHKKIRITIPPSSLGCHKGIQYLVTARLVLPVHGSRQALNFENNYAPPSKGCNFLKERCESLEAGMNTIGHIFRARQRVMG